MMDINARPKRRLRCAIYTRKSSEEGLDMEFNSLDAQREACEAYIASQRSEGYPEHRLQEKPRKPAYNFQMTLVDAVARWLAWNPAWLGRMPGSRSANGLREAAQIWIGPSPTLSNQPPPLELEQMLHVAKKFDVAGRDERNRALGRAGEERVVAHERSALKVAGRDDLARKVRWISEVDGDGAGYDIASFTPDGQERLIEV